VAAYTAHTFDAAYKTLNTTYYDAHGAELYTFTVTRGVTPGPAPPPPAPKGSCAVYGCVAYDKSHSVRGRKRGRWLRTPHVSFFNPQCQCDSDCGKYGECCSDYKTVCGGFY
jgi:hypothetical protein